MSRPNNFSQQSSRQAYQRQQGIHQTLKTQHHRQQSIQFDRLPRQTLQEKQPGGIVGFFKWIFG